MFCMLKKEKKYPFYVSKNNWNHEKEVILLIIPNGEGRHYVAAKFSFIKRNNIKK